MPPEKVPAWHGPRTEILGVPALSPVVIVRTHEVAVAATDLTAYPDGFSFNLDVRLRETGDIVSPQTSSLSVNGRRSCLRCWILVGAWNG